MEDSFDNVNWKLEGRLGDLDIVYAGAYTKRETDQMIDYTDYLFVGQYLPYYICDTTVTYPEYNYYNPGYASNIPAGTCYAPDTYVTSYSETTVSTHELRFTTDQDKSVRATGGVFYSDLELQERVDFRYPGMLESNFWNKYDGVDSPLNMPFDDGFLSQEGPFPRDTIFRNDIKRTDEQVGVFGEVTFDLNDEFSFTAGARWYDVRVDMEGGANSSFGNFFQGTDVDAFGTNITDLYDGDGKLTFIGDSKLATELHLKMA